METFIQTDKPERWLSIERTSGVPLYVQLREQILAAVGSGRLQPNARLPTMRDVAVALKIDLNTVQRAYSELERDGVIFARRGAGTFVSERPPPVDPALDQVRVESLAQKTIASAEAQGIDPVEVGHAVVRIASQKSG